MNKLIAFVCMAIIGATTLSAQQQNQQILKPVIQYSEIDFCLQLLKSIELKGTEVDALIEVQTVLTKQLQFAVKEKKKPEEVASLEITVLQAQNLLAFLQRASLSGGERRRVGQGGKNNLNMPDFGDMLSANNRYMTDITDKETLNLKSSKKLMEEFEQILSESREQTYVARPVISQDVVRLTSKLDEYFASIGTKRKKKMLTEQDVNLQDLNWFTVIITQTYYRNLKT